MDLNLNDWLGRHLWLLWLFLAALCVALELLRRDRWYATLAAAAGITALLALALGRLWWAQVPILVVLFVGGLLVLRPRLRRGAPDS